MEYPYDTMNQAQQDHRSAGSENAKPHRPIRVVLVDDHENFISSLDQFLSKSKRMKVVGVAHSGEEALGIIDAQETDLVLMDIFMKPMNGFEATHRIKEKNNMLKVIILSFYDSPELHTLTTNARADGFVTKSCIGTQLMQMINTLFPEEMALKARTTC